MKLKSIDANVSDTFKSVRYVGSEKSKAIKTKIALLFLFFVFYGYGQNKCLEYLVSNALLFDHSEEQMILGVPDSVKAIIVGERHFIAENTSLHYTLIKNYNRETGLDLVLIEYPPSMSFFIQRYLDSGEEAHLDTAFDSVPYGEDGKNLFKKIKELNDEIAKPIKVVGIDLEVGGFKRPNLIIEELKTIFKSQKKQKLIADYLQSFDNEKVGKNSKEKFQTLYAHFHQKKKKIQKRYPILYLNIELTIENMQDFFPEKEEEIYTEAFQVRRDSFMYLNIIKLDQMSKIENCYIKAGFHHAGKIEDERHRRLAHYLEFETNSPFKHQLKTARLNYKGIDKDALGHELRFKEVLDNTNLTEKEIEMIYGGSGKTIAVVKIDHQDDDCGIHNEFDYLIYIRNIN